MHHVDTGMMLTHACKRNNLQNGLLRAHFRDDFAVRSPKGGLQLQFEIRQRNCKVPDKHACLLTLFCEFCRRRSDRIDVSHL